MKLKNKTGLTIDFLDNGSVENIEVDNIRLNLKPGNLFAKSGTNIFLRKREQSIISKALIGPESDTKFAVVNNAYIAKGNWNGLEFTCTLQVSMMSNSWYWAIKVTNTTDQQLELDSIYMQEVGLKTVMNSSVNEYYVSQYLERLMMTHDKHGAVVACRQNMKENGGHPWLLLASTEKAVSGTTDGLKFYGLSHRTTGIPEALSKPILDGNFAGESPVVAIQSENFSLKPSETSSLGFIGAYILDHPKATSVEDLKLVDKTIDEFSEIKLKVDENEWNFSQKNIFQLANPLPVDYLNESEINTFFGKHRTHEEIENAKLYSFFTDNHTHVVLHEKEFKTNRPHGHIIQAKIGFQPDEEVMSTTCYVSGVFNSHITQGNTNFNVLLSTNTSQFNANLNTGQRVFVEIDGQYFNLGNPSAFEMGLNFCRWIYKYGDYILEIKTHTTIDEPVINFEFDVLEGKKVKLILTHQWDNLNRWLIKNDDNTENFKVFPDKNTLISEKFPNSSFDILIHNPKTIIKDSINDNTSDDLKLLNSHFFVLETTFLKHFALSFVGNIKGDIDKKRLTEKVFSFKLNKKAGYDYWKKLSNNLFLETNEKNLSAINEIMPWYGLNAMTHFLTPYGLEQFSGAAWGTRDVSQGPIEFLLALEKYNEARDVLLTIFSNQNPHGDWPQWWMFDSFNHIRAGDCHGDIYYWVIIALANYIKVTGDKTILDEKVPYFGRSDKASVSEHIDCLIKMIVDSYIKNTSFVPFGGGDWNDSLQPVNEDMAKRLISSWTVQMNYQAFKEYADVFDLIGDNQKSLELIEITHKIKSDFNKYLIKDNVVAGYGYVEDDGSISILLHPSDNKTGIKYSLLPMDRGILSGIFTKDQAIKHQKIINSYLKGPDGARLMDKPLKYKGGIQKIFQRAESSTFFGREIGLMYIHEHIRYAESQAVLGNANEFIKALRQAIPVHYKDWVKNSDLRQANCYYSSSDVAFKTRYEADEKYQDVLNGRLTVSGGWRVYSSGPGIYISLIIKKLIGFRVTYNKVIIDPVLTKDMDELKFNFLYRGKVLTFKFSVTDDNYHPKKIIINGQTIAFSEAYNPYRKGGAEIKRNEFEKYLNKKMNQINIFI